MEVGRDSTVVIRNRPVIVSFGPFCLPFSLFPFIFSSFFFLIFFLPFPFVPFCFALSSPLFAYFILPRLYFYTRPKIYRVAREIWHARPDAAPRRDKNSRSLKNEARAPDFAPVSARAETALSRYLARFMPGVEYQNNWIPREFVIYKQPLNTLEFFPPGRGRTSIGFSAVKFIFTTSLQLILRLLSRLVRY